MRRSGASPFSSTGAPTSSRSKRSSTTARSSSAPHPAPSWPPQAAPTWPTRVDGYDVQDGAAWSVVVKGRGHVVREANERLNAAALPIFPWQEGRKSWFVRIEPLSVTGGRFPLSGGARSTVPQS
jgi:hypothetical protein